MGEKYLCPSNLIFNDYKRTLQIIIYNLMTDGSNNSTCISPVNVRQQEIHYEQNETEMKNKIMTISTI